MASDKCFLLMVLWLTTWPGGVLAQEDAATAQSFDTPDSGTAYELARRGGEPGPKPGYFFPVTIVADIDDDTRLVREEPFGPILPVLRFTDVEDALQRANDSSSGLGGSVWSSDVERASQLASRLECGTAWVNNHAMIQPDAPFGGIKESGFGVEFGRYGLEEYTSIQTVQISKA